MDFWNYTTFRDTTARQKLDTLPFDDRESFYEFILQEAAGRSGQFYQQMLSDRNWERERRPYYRLWPGIVPLLTRLNLDFDSGLIQMPLPALCIRLPKAIDKNPLKFDWQGNEVAIRCMLLAVINEGRGLSVLIDIGEEVPQLGGPLYTYRNFRRQPGVSVEDSLQECRRNVRDEMGIQLPDALSDDCIRLCCSLCLLENDPSVISPDVLATDRSKYAQSGDERYVEKAHRRGKIGWDVGCRIEVLPHYRRPHMMLAWTGTGRSVPKIVPRKGSVIHRQAVERLPSGFGG